MKLFVDDERPAPAGWDLALTSAEAIAVLERHASIRNVSNALGPQVDRIEAISLDHDLGGDDTTRPVVLFMCEFECWPERLYVHTGNPIGEEWLCGMVRRYAPPGTLKGWGLNYWGTGPDSVMRNPAST